MLYVNLNSTFVFVQLDFELDENYYLGTTYEDYLSGAWVPLNNEQAEFHNTNPSASVKEVFDCVLIPPYVYTLEDAKQRKISEIGIYDRSEEVNRFFISDSPLWLDKETRVGLMNSITIEKNAGRTETNLWFNGMSFTFPVDDAIGMLNLLELYALDCYNTTQRHIASVQDLATKEEVEAYDYKTGYPEKLNF